MSRVDVDEVEPGLARPQRRHPVPSAQVADVLLVHGAGLHRVVGEGGHRQARRGHRHLPRVEVGAVHPVVGELDPRQRPELVDPVRHPRQHRDVAVVPQPQLDEGGDVRGVVELDLLGAHHRPAAFGLDPAHPGERGGVAVAHAVAVGDLVETVLRGHRPDGDRFEEDVVAGVTSGIAGHLASDGWSWRSIVADGGPGRWDRHPAACSGNSALSSFGIR